MIEEINNRKEKENAYIQKDIIYLKLSHCVSSLKQAKLCQESVSLFLQNVPLY